MKAMAGRVGQLHAGRQRRRGRGRRSRLVRRRAGAAGQDGRPARRRDVCAVPVRRGRAMPAAAGGRDAGRGASSFVNPLTALGMVETMRREGHSALVHTAAASNLGQMLNRICIEGRHRAGEHRPQAGAGRHAARRGAHVGCAARLAQLPGGPHRGLVATGATIAFDATGGGKLAGQILGAMEAALNRTTKEYSRYGSSTLKQVYIYGGLDTGPTELNRNFGMAWGIGGWLLVPVPAADRRRGGPAAESSASPPN